MTPIDSLVSGLLGFPPIRRIRALFERAYIRVLATAWGVQPERLFDAQYYMRTAPNVAQSGMNPLYHYLRYGYHEGGNPHPFFDTRYYLERYPDVKRSGYNPLLHYLRFGGREGRLPHPNFDGGYYLHRNPDLAAGTNPLLHFLDSGAEEGRMPHPEFDSEFYLLANPDVAATGMNPLIHFRRQGAAEGRLMRRPGGRHGPPERLLPVKQHVRKTPRVVVDVVVPVYRGFQETIACIESVLASAGATSFRLLVVNDCSPAPEIVRHLRNLASSGSIVLIENERNFGFVASVNRGMQASDADVVLLNSDTLVFPGWLERLAACAYSGERIGTVSPFSNNATICSYPKFCADNALEPSLDLATLDLAFDRVNCGRSVDVPTTVGFCMYIRRDCLRETGWFDVEAFQLGYGEENDFCMRAAARGWEHRLACDVFVFHEGSVSFGRASARQEQAMQKLIQRYPDYPSLIQRHVEADPANEYRIAVTAHLIRHSGRRVRLAVTHALGGGVVQHVRELAALTAQEVIWLRMKPAGPQAVTVECEEQSYRFAMTFHVEDEFEHILTMLRACGVERIHIHHVMGYKLDILRLVHDLNAPFDFTVHDYYSICPQINLSDVDGAYCGEPDSRGCNLCLLKRPPADGPTDIASWRARHAWLLTRAKRVIAPSLDVAGRISRYYPEADLIAAEHAGPLESSSVSPRPLSGNEPLRIAVLGTMTVHKGFHLLNATAAAARHSRLPLEFVLIGNVEAGLRYETLPFVKTGAYAAGELPGLLQRVAPHLVWFPARWPETFSYTLSTCLELGWPIAAHETGAFPERSGGRPWTWITPSSYTAKDWIALFSNIRDRHFLLARPPLISAVRPRAARDFYPARYLSAATTSPPSVAINRRISSELRIAAAVATDETGDIQACGYIRVIQPLTHPALTEELRVTVTSPIDLIDSRADVVLVQRTAVRDLQLANRIVESCRNSGALLVFELDDALFDIPAEHPEHGHYTRISEAARRVASCADAITVSTEALRERMLAYNQLTLVLPNYLDDRLWRRPAGRERPAMPIRILYAGTASHKPDLELLGAAVRKLPRSVRRLISIEVAGVSGGAADDWYTLVPIPPDSLSYPRFVEWIQRENRWHWGVAPLLDNGFNRCKSAIKFLEYSALGLPSICSDVPAYHDIVRDGETGLLVPNDVASWCKALTKAATERTLWNRLQNGSATVARENTIYANAGAVRSTWSQLQRQRGKKAARRRGSL